MSTYSSVVINAGDKEPVVVFAILEDGEPATGKTDIQLTIRRSSDGYYFDWSDNTFKVAVSVIQMEQLLVEVSSVFSPGEYFLNTVDHVRGFDTSKITNPVANDTYFITAEQDPGTDLMGFPHKGEIRVRDTEEMIVDREPVIF